MDLFSEFQTAVQQDLTIDSSSTLFTPTIVKSAINRAYRKAGGLFRWAELEDAKKTSTIANQEYYDYPINWQPDSLWKVRVDGTDYGAPLIFKDYLYEQENNYPSGLTNLWSSQWRRFFITTNQAVPTSNGNNNIEIWGQKTTSSLVYDDDVTIFSYSMPECNEAVILEAVAILRSKGEDNQDSQFRSLEAKQIFTIAWNKIRQNQTKYQDTQSYFNVPDFFKRRGNSGNSSNGSPIANF